MKILLTGANGFLGGALSKEFKANGFDLVETSRSERCGAIPCDLTSVSAVEDLLNKIDPDMIVHCAASVPERLEDYHKPEMYKQNSRMVSNLTMNPSIPFVYISSMTVYGNDLKEACVESDRCSPNSSYAISKMEGEKCVEERCVSSVSFRIPGLYSETRHSGLVYNVIRALITGGELKLPDEQIVWAAMHVTDVAYSIVSSITNLTFGSMNETINIGYYDEYSINNLIRDCEEVWGGKIGCHIEHPKFIFDLNKIERLDSTPQSTTLRDSLAKMKSYYIDHFKDF